MIERPIQLKTAIVHDWLPQIAGGERVVQNIAQLCQNAEIFTLVDFLSPGDRSIVSGGHPVSTSYLNKLPGVKRYYRYLLLEATRAIETFDLTKFDLVVSSSAALAKGVITGPNQRHIAYVHTPARYAWDLTHEYLNSIDGIGGVVKRALAQRMLHKFRMWDIRTAPSIDVFVANSKFIQSRIWKFYRRESEVIYPPVNIDRFKFSELSRSENYLTVTRLVPYKRVDLMVQAFNQRPKLKLRVIGDGPEFAKLKATAGPNITFLGNATNEDVQTEMASAKAFVFAALEDFGISPVEAQACGTPVIALGHGGTAETVVDVRASAPTGVLFPEQTIESLLTAIDQFESNGSFIRPADCRQNAERFSQDQFNANFLDLISRSVG